MTERFKRAYDLLVKAYFEGTLRAGDCTACAVGNICEGWGDWTDLFCEGYILNYRNKSNAKVLEELCPIKSGGYSWVELAKIEAAFENNTIIKYRYDPFTDHEILADQFNGLKAVIELMMGFDNIEGDQYVDKFKEKLQSA